MDSFSDVEELAVSVLHVAPTVHPALLHVRDVRGHGLPDAAWFGLIQPDSPGLMAGRKKRRFNIDLPIILNTPGRGGCEQIVDSSLQVVKITIKFTKHTHNIATSCKRRLDLHRTFTNPPTSEHCPVAATAIAPFPFPCVQAGFMKPISAHSRERPRRTTHVAYGSGINQTDTGTNIPKHPCPAASTIIP